MSQAQITIGLAQISQQVGESYYFPYSVGLLQAFVQKHASQPERYRFLPPVYRRLTLTEAQTYFAPAAIVGFSLYIWNLRRSLYLAAALKAQNPNLLVVVGGPQVPDQAEDFLRVYPQIDLCCHGPGERVFLALLERWPSRDWSDLAGVSYIRHGQFFYNPPAPREKDLSIFPSPYLEGVFDLLLKENSHWIGLLETNRGCPFACTFCDWGSAIQTKIYSFPLDRVYAEIEWFARHRIANIFTCDANFGILPRDVEIARYVAAMKRQYGYPLSFQNQTSKNTPQRVIEIQQILQQAGLATYAAISLQTVDPYTLRSIKRENISLEAYQRIQAAAIKAGIAAYTDMILALPGESYESFVEGINRVIESGQHTKILFHNATLLPNAEMAQPEYRQRFSLETTWVSVPGHTPASDNIPELMEIIVATHTLSREDWVRMHLFAWFTAFLYYTHKLLQPTLMVLRTVSGLSYRFLIETFMDTSLLQHYPLLAHIRACFEDTARKYQQGYPISQENTLIWTLFDGMYLTPDNVMQIELWNADLIDRFYMEAGDLLASQVKRVVPDLDLRLLAETLRFNQQLFMRLFSAQRFPVPVVSRSNRQSAIALHYNLQAFYQGLLMGEPVPLQEIKTTLVKV